MTLRIFLLGDLRLTNNHAPLGAFATRKAKVLFAFLVLSRERLFSREALAGQFWGDVPEDRAKRSLNTDLWRIRQTLAGAGLTPADFLLSGTDGIGFNPAAPHWVDVDVFERHVQPVTTIDPGADDPETCRKVAEAIALYRGDLLEGVYDDWCLMRREALRARLVEALEFLLGYHVERQEWDRALAYGQRLLALDPLLEHIHRALMRCHYLMGNRPAALRQYHACARLLRDELDVEPMEETTRVYETMLSVQPRPPQATAERARGERLHDRKSPLEEVDLALANLYTAQGWLEDASRQLRPSPSPRKP